ncbi:hypothetical protein ABPG75_008271 [Micractinium tetrahymenae]
MQRRWPPLARSQQTTSRRQAAGAMLIASSMLHAGASGHAACGESAGAVPPPAGAGPALAGRAAYLARCLRRLRLRLQNRTGRSVADRAESSDGSAQILFGKLAVAHSRCNLLEPRWPSAQLTAASASCATAEEEVGEEVGGLWSVAEQN